MRIGSNYPDDWSSIRRRVYSRDNYRCQSCGVAGGSKGNTELHAHHKIAISDGGGHQLSNLITLCHNCHEKKHGHPIFSGENTSKKNEGSDLDIFSLGIQNLWPDWEVSQNDDSDFYDWSQHNENKNEKLTLPEAVCVGVFLTPALFVFMSVFWVSLYDGEGYLFSLGVLVILLAFLGIPLLVAAVIVGLLPAAIVYGVLDFFLVGDELGRELSDREAMAYVISSLSSVVLFNYSLLRSASHEITLIQAIWPATKLAIVGTSIILISTTILLFLWWVVTNPVETE